MSEIININFDFNNEQNNQTAIKINENSMFNTAPEETKQKVYSHMSGFGGMVRKSIFDGVGHDLTQCEEYECAMEEAGINYTGEKSSIYLADGTIIPNNFAITKSDDPHCVIGVVGNQYQAIGNHEAFEVAGEIVSEGMARYELGGPCIGAKNKLDYSRTFLALRGDDFDIAGDEYESFIVFNNSFDGSGGIKYQVLCQRLVCLNGMVRYLNGKKNQLQITIQHTKSASDRIKQAHDIVMKRVEDVETLKRQAQALIGVKMSKEDFQKKIIPLVLKNMKLVENDKDRERGQERIDRTVMQLLGCYNADDVQNFNGTAWQIMLALSDFESHAEPLRNTGNRSIYLNRVSKGMVLSQAVASYIADQHGIALQ